MSSLPSYRHAASRCPQCSYRLDASTKAHGEKGAPEEGDASVCINCGQVLIYAADLSLRKATAEEIRELMDNAKAWAVIESAQRFIQHRGRIR